MSIANYSTNKRKEQEVVNRLNHLGFEVELNQDELGVYDISGYDGDGNKVLIEVKSRRQWWSTMFIETAKLRALKAIKDQQDDEVYVMLVLIVGDEFLAYDCKDIWNFGKTIEKAMNRTTSFENNNKVVKEVKEFDRHSWCFCLDTGEVNKLRYEYKK